MDYFSDKIKKLMGRLPAQDDPMIYLRMALQRWKKKDNFPGFNFREVTTSETLRMIGKLGNSTACRLDELDGHAIRLAVEILVLPIKHIINTSLTEARFANKWKISKTIPLLKNKDLNKLSPSSYRPVALLSTISKVVERAA